MKITEVHIDGFGVWHDLKLGGLSPQLTAFYGANEAGKTTLMQFMRGVLYGVSPKRRSRYLPPLNGGRPGGSLRIVEDGQALHVTRFADRGPDDLGLVTIVDEVGHATGDRLLRDALAGVDEKTYENVFALGLGEIQQLATLSDTQASEWLYRLTSGLDRVSLYDVIQGLRKTRKNLLSGREQDSLIAQLLTRREVLRGEISQLSQQNRRWSQLAIRIEELDAEILAQEAKVAEHERRARTIEIAVGLKENWRRRAKLTSQLLQFNSSIQLPEDAGARLDALNRKLEEHQREADILEGQRRQLREETDRLGINELLVQNAARIDALGEQRDWLISLDRQIDDLDTEAKDIHKRFTNEQERLASLLGITKSEHLKQFTTAEFENLEPLLDDIQAAQKKVDAATKEVDALTENERSLKVRIDSAIVGGESHGLPMDLQEASDLVAQLRRRLQVEQRLEQARSHEIDLEHQSHELLEDQVMPLWLFGWTLAAVVLGSLMVGLWLWVPNNPLGNHGSLIALGGLGATIFMFVFKFFTEDAAADKLDACQRQMESLTRQREEAEKEKEVLDAELPLTDGSVVLRLQAAEKHLAELENVLPVEAQRKRAGHEVSTAQSRLEQAQAQLEKATAAWRTKLVGLGISEKLDPLRFAAVAERFAALGDLEERVTLRREEIIARQREHATLTRRIHDLALEVGCVLLPKKSESPKSVDLTKAVDPHISLATPIDQLEHLVAERRKQLAGVERRVQLFERAKELKAQEREHRRTVAGIRRRREGLFHAADCEDEVAYRRVIEDQQQAYKLRAQRESVTREIAAAIGTHAPEDTFASLLSPENIDKLDDLWEQFSQQLEAAQSELKSLVDGRGARRHEQRLLAEDRSLAERQLELSCLEKQLENARQEWREHATVSRVLERLRHHYEKNRQPETLSEASRYMAQLTGGEYVRVWTPIADDILLVENSAGQSLQVEVLSRGTREQLFLSIRLAVVSTFAKRGVQLPMVLDDVLVNFDAVRTQRAAEVLRDFAAGGHQVMLFTCHEHMWQMFKTLDTDCRRLPNRFGETVEIIPDEPFVVEEIIEAEIIEKGPKPKKPRKQRRVIVQEVIAPEPVDFYDYPFVERIEQETVRTPAAVSNVVTEYTVPVAETTYEWLIDEEEENDYAPLFRDHLEPRRA
ncbi:MAG: AAA family ATPase [Bythopirellula sp.]|nr:AAA family ATPase [Bythopirellula sp.]